MKATVYNTPRALINVPLTLNNHYKLLPNETELEAGKDMVITASGHLRLYMGDDMRKDKPIQIIISCFNGELGYLPIERKIGVELRMEETLT